MLKNSAIAAKLLSGCMVLLFIAWGGNLGWGRGSAWAESGINKRVEEFKTGMEKSAAHGQEEGKTAISAHGDDKKKIAAKKVKYDSHKASGHKPPDTHAGGNGEHATAVDADEALKLLLNGNKRYMSGHAKGPNRSVARRSELAKAQHPIAVIVSCSDSRVPPELLFDQGFGDIFVVRTAGNIVDSITLGSIEYAVDHLGTKLVVVLGHERCGAVTAALQGGDAPGNIKNVLEAIKPAVEKGKTRHTGHGELLDSCIRSNVKQVAEKIRTTAPILSEKVEDGMLKVVGAYYDLDSGAVTMTYMP